MDNILEYCVLFLIDDKIVLLSCYKGDNCRDFPDINWALAGLLHQYFRSLFKRWLSILHRIIYGFSQIILGIICLIITLSGILYLKNARKILRLKLDEKGIYYLPFAESNPSKYKALFNQFYLREALKFIPYDHIAFAELVIDKKLGEFVRINLKNGETKRLLTAPFTLSNKKEVVLSINSQVK